MAAGEKGAEQDGVSSGALPHTSRRGRGGSQAVAPPVRRLARPARRAPWWALLLALLPVAARVRLVAGRRALLAPPPAEEAE